MSKDFSPQGICGLQGAAFRNRRRIGSQSAMDYRNKHILAPMVRVVRFNLYPLVSLNFLFFFFFLILIFFFQLKFPLKERNFEERKAKESVVLGVVVVGVGIWRTRVCCWAAGAVENPLSAKFPFIPTFFGKNIRVLRVGLSSWSFVVSLKVKGSTFFFLVFSFIVCCSVNGLRGLGWNNGWSLRFFWLGFGWASDD